MGITRFSGPAYGAKATLLTGYQAVISSGAGNGISSTTNIFTIPAGEDWYATELSAFRKSTGSTGMACALLDDSTVVATATINSSLADASTTVTITADGGEYEGTRLAAGSVIAFRVTTSSVCSTSSDLTMTLRGFTRWVDSSRAF